MNKTYTNEYQISRRYNNSKIGNSRSYAEVLFEIIISALESIYAFVTDQTVVLISKMVITFLGFAAMFIFAGLFICGTLSFTSAFLPSVAITAIITFIFKSMF